MDVGGWLRGLGLGQYEANFRDNKIDADLLPRLTGDDLKDIGVFALGDRLRLLEAIAALAGAKPPSDVPASPPKSASPKRSRSLGRAPPDHRDVLRSRRFDGHCRETGRGGLAQPRQHLSRRSLRRSDRTWRARAEAARRRADGSLRLPARRRRTTPSARCGRRSPSSALLVRSTPGTPPRARRNCWRASGSKSGPVVVEAAGEVFGDAPNVAARVQGLAEPGTVLVTANVQRQAAGLFVAEDRGAHELKGIPAPVTLYRIVRASGGRRFGAPRPHPARRARGGARPLASALGAGGERRGPVRPDRRRARHRQVAPRRGVSLEARRGAAHLCRMVVVATFAEYAVAPARRMGTPALRRGGARRRRLADLENTLRLIDLDPGEYAPLLAPLVDIPLPDERVAKLAPEELRRRQLAGADRMGPRRGAIATGGARVRGLALGRSDLARSDAGSRRARRAGAAAHRRDHAARVPTAMELARPPQRHLAAPP